jgi:hypothetical protein
VRLRFRKPKVEPLMVTLPDGERITVKAFEGQRLTKAQKKAGLTSDPNRAMRRSMRRSLGAKPNAAPKQCETFRGFTGSGPSEKARQRAARRRKAA